MEWRAKPSFVGGGEHVEISAEETPSASGLGLTGGERQASQNLLAKATAETHGVTLEDSAEFRRSLRLDFVTALVAVRQKGSRPTAGVTALTPGLPGEEAPTAATTDRSLPLRRDGRRAVRWQTHFDPKQLSQP